MRSGHGFQNRLGPRKSATLGGVAEWSNAPVLKTGVRESVPWVRIPPPPPRALEGVLSIRLRPDFSVSFEGYAGEAEHWPRREEGLKCSLSANILWT
jgi:hypothetical protein